MPDPWCTLHLVSLCSVYFAIDVLYSGTRMKYKFHAVFSMQTCIGFQQSVNQKLQNSVPSLNKNVHWKMLQDGRGNASEGNLWSHVARRSTIILLGDMRSFLGLWRAQIESQNQIKKWYCHRPWSSHTSVIFKVIQTCWCCKCSAHFWGTLSLGPWTRWGQSRRVWYSSSGPGPHSGSEQKKAQVGIFRKQFHGLPGYHSFIHHTWEYVTMSDMSRHAFKSRWTTMGFCECK